MYFPCFWIFSPEWIGVTVEAPTPYLSEHRCCLKETHGGVVSRLKVNQGVILFVVASYETCGLRFCHQIMPKSRPVLQTTVGALQYEYLPMADPKGWEHFQSGPH